MKRFLLTASFLVLSATASFALEPGCNPAIQNWVNGSHTTCPVKDWNNQKEERYRMIERCYEHVKVDREPT